MPQRISNLPIGLLGMLDAKSFGANPAELLDSIAGVIDLRDQFLLNDQEFLNQVPAQAAVAQTTVIFPNLVVPQNELWYVWAADVQTETLGAGETIRLLPQVRVIATDAVALAPARSAVAAEQALVPVDRPFWMRPAQAFAFLSEQLTGAVLVGAHMLITRIRI